MGTAVPAESSEAVTGRPLGCKASQDMARRAYSEVLLRVMEIIGRSEKYSLAACKRTCRRQDIHQNPKVGMR